MVLFQYFLIKIYPNIALFCIEYVEIVHNANEVINMNDRTFLGILSAFIVLAFWAVVGSVVIIIAFIQIFLDLMAR